jgi:asparagine synthase (glutamine-hydrolysing)
MSNWGRFVVREQLLGHMFPKIDRAAAEQGVETRSPLLDWDLMAFARPLPPDVLLANGQMKAVLRSQLCEWPEWFLDRPKIGFTFHLRWLWLLSGYDGARELVTVESIERFRALVPKQLRSGPSLWTSSVIFNNFKSVWKLLAWSDFERRFSEAQREPVYLSVPTEPWKTVQNNEDCERRTQLR